MCRLSTTTGLNTRTEKNGAERQAPFMEAITEYDTSEKKTLEGGFKAPGGTVQEKPRPQTATMKTTTKKITFIFSLHTAPNYSKLRTVHRRSGGAFFLPRGP